MENLQEKIEKIIPYISENFISYPMWEEGNYIPFINFWLSKESKCFPKLDGFIKEVSEKNYIVEERAEDNDPNSKIVNYMMYPDFYYHNEAYPKCFNANWTIEEMIELLGTLND